MPELPETLEYSRSFSDWTRGLNTTINYVRSLEIGTPLTEQLVMEDSEDGQLFELKLDNRELIIEQTEFNTQDPIPTNIVLQDNDFSIFEIRVVNGELSVTKIEEGSGARKPRVTYGSSLPQTGYYFKGDRHDNTDPQPGGYVGWVCVADGDISVNSNLFRPYGKIEE